MRLSLGWKTVQPTEGGVRALQGRNLPGRVESPKPENKGKMGEGEQSGRRQLGLLGKDLVGPLGSLALISWERGTVTGMDV